MLHISTQAGYGLHTILCRSASAISPSRRYSRHLKVVSHCFGGRHLKLEAAGQWSELLQHALHFSTLSEFSGDLRTNSTPALRFRLHSNPVDCLRYLLAVKKTV